MLEVVVLSPRQNAEPLTLEVGAGASLMDLCDEASAPVPFSCRSATCGTCRVIVLEGASLLSRIEADEADILALFAGSSILPPDAVERLACQAKVHGGSGRIIIRAADDDA
jgi:2Fe-2S ferredoxin